MRWTPLVGQLLGLNKVVGLAARVEQRFADILQLWPLSAFGARRRCCAGGGCLLNDHVDGRKMFVITLRVESFDTCAIKPGFADFKQ